MSTTSARMTSARYRGTLKEPGPQQPVPRPHGCRKPRPVPAHAGRRVSERGKDAARQDRHGVGQHQLRDPVLYRVLHAHSPAHRRRVVHLSDLRLRARPVGCDRGHHAFGLHIGICRPPAALRLVDRQPADTRHAEAVRVRAPQPDAHRALEAQADAARAGRRRDRLG